MTRLLAAAITAAAVRAAWREGRRDLRVRAIRDWLRSIDPSEVPWRFHPTVRPDDLPTIVKEFADG